MAVASHSETVKLTRGGGLREAVAFEGNVDLRSLPWAGSGWGRGPAPLTYLIGYHGYG